ncbi:hypothetical protein FIV42_15420 [Persicimonas caeni]|uniref:Uncharacterized protein n=1 Tax=Persicimonas caeni TaxID=2292766 RepID=A0A4Y6PUT1_PERCE|nr:hypothetical protein [Persicimonas caeni]QDG52082.1 hypothetical protein FIV42_15420 [Persicimonas caeni]QED33303.1 hypothetical protein FRD00_15415 [Persicimonas caeni]
MYKSGRKAIISREELYERVWNTPVYRLADEFGLSGRGLGKICERHRIPTPPRGYWAKLQHGNDVDREPLPKLAENEQRFQTISFYPPPPDPPLSADEQEQIEQEQKAEREVVVPEELRNPHPLVKRTKRALERAKPGRYARLHPAGDDTLSVAVGRPSIDRAMRIMDALIKALEERGHEVVVEKNHRGEKQTAVKIGGESVPFELTERAREEVRELKTTGREAMSRRFALAIGDDPTVREFFPSGELTLSIVTRIYHRDIRRTWSDAKKQRVEDCLNDFISSVIKTAAALRERRKEQEEAARQREIEKAREAEEEKARQARERELEEERRRLTELEAEADAWHRAQRIRAYVGAVIAEKGTGEDGSELSDWIAWAKRKADELDPLS